MVTVHCVATLPVVVPDGVEMRFLNDMEHMTFQVLEYFSHAQIDLDEFGTVCPRAYLPEGPSTSELVPIIWKEAVLRLLRLDFDVRIAGIETGWDEVSEESTRSASEFLAMKIGKALNDIVIAANIASPGSFSSSGGQVTVGGLAGTPVPPLNGWTIRDGLLTSEGYGWPTMVRLPFGKVWEWLHRQPGFHSGFSDDSTSRALVAFTNVMTSADLMQLFWAVLGLESLFVPEEGKVRYQLRRNTESLLGPRREFRDSVDRMYSFRSDFIHGAANIPAPIMADPTSPAVGYYFEELEVTAAVAVGVLTASVQDMVRRDWDLVAFENGVAKGKRRSETRG